MDRRRLRTRVLCVAVGLAVTAGLIRVIPMLVGGDSGGGGAQREPVIAGRLVKPGGEAPAPKTGQPFKGADPRWPAAASVMVNLAGAARRAAGTPLSVAPLGDGSPEQVRVQTYDHGEATTAGIDGVLFRLARTDGVGQAGPVRVAVDYGDFRWAYGADWATRLRLVELPECALSTPEKAECRSRPVASGNDTTAATVSAIVNVPGAEAAGGRHGRQTPGTGPAAGVLLAVTAAPSGAAGDYTATPLSSAATWASGGNSGDFAWSYPLRVPPLSGGPAPSLALSYSSASVDGRMAASNNQPSWLGEGFELSTGAIERKYRSCAEDMADGPNNTDKTGDLCWATDNATLSMSGHAGELIKDGGGGWHLRADDGTRVERRTGAANGARDGEHWVVTTTDGVQYWFGSRPAANSTLTVPVFGNHGGEPCHAAAFKDSACTQAWRWALDHVVDLHANTMTFWYAKETNTYARNGTATDLAGYDRASYLTRIDYGTRTDSTGSAPTQVEFATADRCLSGCGTHDAAHWPDTSWDLECTASPCRVTAPTFWTTKRLTGVKTRVWNATGYRDVESWTFGQSFADPGDGTRAGLWLDKISHTGLAGQAVSVPDVTFAGVQLNNRVDTADHSPPMNWWRIKTINTEAGGRITVDYTAPDCVAGARMPSAPEDNSLRCYPVKWTPAGHTGAVTDFFHKYVVTDVSETDLTSGVSAPPRVLTHYDYLGDPAWRYTDDDGLVTDDHKTWSVWRGYPAVRATKGDPGAQTSTETRYFRGMHGDHLPSGTRAVTLPAIAVGDIPAATDEDAYAGMARESIVYNGPGGAEVSAAAAQPWQSAPTAERTINGVTVYARHAAIAGNHTRATLDGGRAPRTTGTATTFDTYGLPTRVDDHGDDAVPGDEKCTLTDYARNTSAWLLSTISRTRKFAVDCTRASAGGLTDDDIIGDELTFYDSQPHGAAPAKGDVSRTDVLKTYDPTSPIYLTTATFGYDDHGRVTQVTDVRGNTTRTAYTPATGGPVTQTTTTAPLGWVTTKTLDPAWGSPVTTVDPNSRHTDLTYDGLGRVTAVWLPGRSRTTQSANTTYDYAVRNNASSVVTTRRLNPAGGYITTYDLHDGLLRPRQTQKPDAAGGTGAVITDITYDAAGRRIRVTNPYLTDVAPSPQLFIPTETIPARTEAVYDGASRVTAEILKTRSSPNSPGGTEKWRTTTSYAGDRTDITPPAGDTATSTVTDAAGHTVELRQYHGPTPTPATAGSFDATIYAYDRKDKLARITDPAGNHWDHTYDLRGRETHTDDPDKGTSSRTYNDAGDVLTTTDARDTTLAYTYDTIGRKTTLHEGTATGPKRAEWTYDTLANGTLVNGQLVKTIRYADTDAYVQQTTGFTDAYQPTGVAYTIPATEAGLGDTYAYTYTYHPNGAPRSVGLPAVGDLPAETLTYGYDGLGQPTTTDTNYGTNPRTSLVTETRYTSFGELGRYRLRTNDGDYAEVTRAYEEDTRRPAQILTTKQKAPTTVADVRYDHDPAGNVTKIADLTAGDTQCFRTDHLRRLTEAWTLRTNDCAPAPAIPGGPAPYWHTYTYDTVSNRTKLVEHATPAGDRTTTYTPVTGKHALATTTTSTTAATATGSYTYDASGNTRTRPTGTTGTQTLTWDAEGHLATSTDTTGTTNYLYDADGNRLIRRDPTGKTLYLPLQELRRTGTTAATGTRYYSHANLTIATRTSAGITWLSGDHQGTTQITINALDQSTAIHRTTPFGTVRGATGIWPSTMDKGFVGGTNDNTGLTHLGAREYDPETGRFISVDRIFDPASPQQMHGYAYANNTPVTKSDPSGLSPEDAQWEYDHPAQRLSKASQANIAARYNWRYWPGIQGNVLDYLNDDHSQNPATNCHIPPRVCKHEDQQRQPDTDNGRTLPWAPFPTNPNPCQYPMGSDEWYRCTGSPRPPAPPRSTGKPPSLPVNMDAACLNFSAQSIGAVGLSFCVAVDDHGIGGYWTHSTGIGPGEGGAVTVGHAFSNGSLEDQRGDASYVDVGFKAGVDGDASLSVSDDAKTYTVQVNGGAAAGAAFGSAGRSKTRTQRWIRW